MKGYIIENYKPIDQDMYVPPVKVIPDALAKYGGKFLVATPKAQTLIGDPLMVNIVLEFGSLEDAQNFYDSSEYAEYKKLFIASTEGWVVITEGYE